jgi:hypothetical protein
LDTLTNPGAVCLKWAFAVVLAEEKSEFLEALP